MEIIGRRLMMLRGRMTQKALAFQLGISESAYRHYERGDCLPPDNIKYLIARFFKVTIYDLFFKGCYE